MKLLIQLGAMLLAAGLSASVAPVELTYAETLADGSLRPTSVILLREISIPILDAGEIVGEKRVPAGTRVFIEYALEDGQLSVLAQRTMTKVSHVETDYMAQAKMLLAQKLKAAEEEKKKEEAARAEKLAQDAAIVPAYLADLRRQLARLVASDAHWTEDDARLARVLAQAISDFLSQEQRSVGGLSREDCLAFGRTLMAIQIEHPITGSEYNEYIEDLVRVPVTFNLFSNADSFYLSIGEGAFSSSTTLTTGEISQVLAAIRKLGQWRDQAEAEKITARKPLRATDGVGFEFRTFEGGKLAYVWITVRGRAAKDSLLDDKTVRMNFLNLAALAAQLENASDLLKRRHEEHIGASRLR